LLTCLYFVLLVAWVILLIVYRDTSVTIQYLIGVVYFLYFLDNLVNAIDYTTYNYNTGHISLGWNITEIVIAPIRKTVSGIIVLLVALGWQIFRRELTRRTKIGIVCIAIALWVFSQISEGVAVFTYTPQLAKYSVSGNAETFLQFVETIAFLALSLWAVFALIRSIKVLAMAGQTEKQLLYKKLLVVVCVCIATYALIYIVTVSFQIADPINFWQANAAFDAVWPLLFFCILFAIFVLFRPSARNSILGFAQLSQEEEPPSVSSSMRSPREDTSNSMAEFATMRDTGTQEPSELGDTRESHVESESATTSTTTGDDTTRKSSSGKKHHKKKRTTSETAATATNDDGDASE